MEMWFIFGFLAISGVSVMIYVGLMVFLPEWVGITGKVALQAEQSHRSESNENTPEQAAKE